MTADIVQALRYLWTREMITKAYKPTLLPVVLSKTQECRALTFVIDRDHANYYTASHNLERVADHIYQARGSGGSNIYYLEKTVAILKRLKLEDKDLSTLLELVYTKRQRLESLSEAGDQRLDKR